MDIYKSKTKKYLQLLSYLKSENNERIDTKIAYFKGTSIENKLYQNKDSSIYPKLNSYLENGLIKSLLNSQSDTDLTAFVARYGKEFVTINENDINHCGIKFVFIR